MKKKKKNEKKKKKRELTLRILPRRNPHVDELAWLVVHNT